MALVQELLQELPVRNYLSGTTSCIGTVPVLELPVQELPVQELPVRQAGPAAGLSRGCLGSRCCIWLLGLRRLGWRVEGGLSLKLKVLRRTFAH